MNPLGQAVSSSGQSGGVTAHSIGTLTINQLPPVTEQERLVAAERLRLTLTDLATYNQRPSDLGQLTLLESTRTERVARRLYVVLSNFFDPTIAQMENGKALIAFKKRYTYFIANEAPREQRSLEWIGRKGPKFSGGWQNLLLYMVLRLYRGSMNSTMESGIQLIEYSPNQAETLFHTFITDDQGGAWLRSAAEEQESLIDSATQLLTPYHQD